MNLAESRYLIHREYSVAFFKALGPVKISNAPAYPHARRSVLEVEVPGRKPVRVDPRTLTKSGLRSVMPRVLRALDAGDLDGALDLFFGGLGVETPAKA